MGFCVASSICVVRRRVLGQEDIVEWVEGCVLIQAIGALGLCGNSGRTQIGKATHGQITLAKSESLVEPQKWCASVYALLFDDFGKLSVEGERLDDTEDYFRHIRVRGIDDHFVCVSVARAWHAANEATAAVWRRIT